ncbi:uncharacterized protein C8A04DRAFT_30159 [Dichotomopilus funicola]|uniref:Uncharacterized protein n=1 Tax=Dichotomopilus funicola TaxID=1934379 RepID=A0AAN6UZQ5_9PEZI|nr:hypothetical protein C8A04DRAFT_30159 [Dichotomopilus funicola]
MGGLGQLSKLPPEILDLILDWLCLHHVHDLQVYVGERSFEPYKSPSHQHDDVRASFTGLASLCRASKYLNQLTTWRLYHSLIEQKTNLGWARLARTLIRRKDLAALVRHLFVEFQEKRSYHSFLPPEVNSYFAEQVALTPGVGLKADSLTRSELADTASEPAAALLTSLCPNLLTAKFASPMDPGLPVALGLSPPGSLASLRDVQILHLDPEFTFDLSVYTRFFRAAPNIRLLRLLQVICSQPLEEGLGLENVTDLELLISCMAGDDLAHILRLCPNVQRLTYVCGPLYEVDQFNPREAVAMVLEHSPKIQRFELDLAARLGYDDWDEDDMLAAKGVLERNRAVECDFRPEPDSDSDSD